jgi:hypothetical protein
MARKKAMVHRDHEAEKVVAMQILKEFFQDASPAELETLYANLQRITKNAPLEKVRRRGDDVEVWLTNGAEYLATSDFTSFMREGSVRPMVGRNATGHFLPASSTSG